MLVFLSKWAGGEKTSYKKTFRAGGHKEPVKFWVVVCERSRRLAAILTNVKNFFSFSKRGSLVLCSDIRNLNSLCTQIKAKKQTSWMAHMSPIGAVSFPLYETQTKYHPWLISLWQHFETDLTAALWMQSEQHWLVQREITLQNNDTSAAQMELLLCFI